MQEYLEVEEEVHGRLSSSMGLQPTLLHILQSLGAGRVCGVGCGLLRVGAVQVNLQQDSHVHKHLQESTNGELQWGLIQDEVNSLESVPTGPHQHHLDTEQYPQDVRDQQHQAHVGGEALGVLRPPDVSVLGHVGHHAAEHHGPRRAPRHQLLHRAQQPLQAGHLHAGRQQEQGTAAPPPPSFRWAPPPRPASAARDLLPAHQPPPSRSAAELRERGAARRDAELNGRVPTNEPRDRPASSCPALAADPPLPPSEKAAYPDLGLTSGFFLQRSCEDCEAVALTIAAPPQHENTCSLPGGTAEPAVFSQVQQRSHFFTVRAAFWLRVLG